MPKNISYKSAGVDIDEADKFIGLIKKDVKSTLSSSVLNREGSFGALFELAKGSYKKPVLVSSTDGVGTKLLIAQHVNKHDTVGIDLVAMNVNDILCTGARPLFFLDYIACGKLKKHVLKDVVKGIAKGCKQSGMSLIGGETAEMPGMYGQDEYDLAGFAVGIVDKNRIIDGSKIKANDVVIGLPSSGLHSNGFSLVRKLFTSDEQKKYADQLLKPTKIYAKELEAITSKVQPKGIAHITGGAFFDKLTKILPKGLCFRIQPGSWPVPIIFQNIQKRGKITDQEMYRTFNMGIGMAVVVGSKQQTELRSFLKKKRIRHYIIGSVVKNPKQRLEI